MCSSRRIGFQANASDGPASVSRASSVELLERDRARRELLLVLVRIGARVGEQREQGGRACRPPCSEARSTSRPRARASSSSSTSSHVSGTRDAEALEQVGPVGADVSGGVDREPPQVPLPLVARVARPDRASGLVGDEVSVEQLVEREERSGRDDLAEVRMVEDEQVVPARRGRGSARPRTPAATGPSS